MTKFLNILWIQQLLFNIKYKLFLYFINIAIIKYKNEKTCIKYGHVQAIIFIGRSMHLIV